MFDSHDTANGPGAVGGSSSGSRQTAVRACPRARVGDAWSDAPGQARCRCRSSALVRDSTEGMPWVPLVLSWLLHQMPRCGERCSHALQSTGRMAVGGVRLLLTLTCCGDPMYARSGEGPGCQRTS